VFLCMVAYNVEWHMRGEQSLVATSDYGMLTASPPSRVPRAPPNSTRRLVSGCRPRGRGGVAVPDVDGLQDEGDARVAHQDLRSTGMPQKEGDTMAFLQALLLGQPDGHVAWHNQPG
jgi:hypothetical protein